MSSWRSTAAAIGLSRQEAVEVLLNGLGLACSEQMALGLNDWVRLREQPFRLAVAAPMPVVSVLAEVKTDEGLHRLVSASFWAGSLTRYGRSVNRQTPQMGPSWP